MAPRINCTYNTKIEHKVSAARLGLRWSNSILGGCSIHFWPVKTAMQTAMQKNVCATVACAVESQGGWKNKTVIPPSVACTITVPKAASASHRSQRRRSTKKVQQAMAKIGRA